MEGFLSRKRKPLNKTDEPSDFGTEERIFHAGRDGIRIERVDKKIGGAKRLRVTNQTPLDRHYTRGQITRRQFEAGQQLYRLWYRAGRSTRVSVDYTAVRVDGGGKGSEGAGEAFTAYLAALRDIGQDLAKVAQWVVIEGSSAKSWAEEQGHDPKGGVVVLRLCLDALGDHFGMARG